MNGRRSGRTGKRTSSAKSESLSISDMSVSQQSSVTYSNIALQTTKVSSSLIHLRQPGSLP